MAQADLIFAFKSEHSPPYRISFFQVSWSFKPPPLTGWFKLVENLDSDSTVMRPVIENFNA